MSMRVDFPEPEGPVMRAIEDWQKVNSPEKRGEEGSWYLKESTFSENNIEGSNSAAENLEKLGNNCGWGLRSV